MQIVGRSSSHWTRMTLIFARALEVPFELVPIYDLKAVGTAVYAGNPAQKMPILREADGRLLFGAQNICRSIAERASRPARIVWPEELRDHVSRNAQELVWHAMAAQVQLIIGTAIGRLPADNMYFAKGRAGLEGALGWLDTHLDEALRALPAPRDLSLFEVSLFCLVEHLQFRVTVPVAPYARLVDFARTFARQPAAERTAYRVDTPPAA